MRYATVLQNWERIRTDTFRSPILETVEYTGISGLVDGQATFKSRITAICGFNGVGKTAFLKAIWTALDKDAVFREGGFDERLGQATVKLSLRVNNSVIQRLLDKGDDKSSDPIPENIEILYHDCAAEALNLQQFFRNINSIEDALNGLDPELLDENALTRHCYIIGKEYTSAEIFEVDSFEPLRPFFRVTEGNTTYDTRSMSLGELSVFLFLWKLDRMPNNSICLIEEPETYISATAQRHMLHVIVDTSIRKRLSFVFSTHSPQLVENLKNDELLILYSGIAGTKFLEPAGYPKFLKKLGLQRHKKLLVFVEDAAARRLCSRIIRQNDLLATLEIEILPTAGAAIITDLREKIPREAQSVAFVGVYDGDMEGKIQSSEKSWPCLYLPGERALELELKQLVLNDLEAAAKYLNCDREDLELSISVIRGIEYHDWVPELAKSLSIPLERIWDQLIEFWLNIPENSTKAKEFAQELSEYIA